MKNCRTNRLHVNLNLSNLLRDYSIVKFTTTEKYIKHGALILDQINSACSAKSIVFDKGKSFYALFQKEKIESLDLVKQLQKIEEGETLTFKILTGTDLAEIPVHTITQLLLNSMASPNHSSLAFNNLTGKLYLFDSNYLKISKSRGEEQVFKIVALEVYVSPSQNLQLNVKTFSNVLLSKKMDFSNKKLKEYPRYTFAHSTNTLRRILDNEKVDNESQFILKQTIQNGKSEKNSIPFLDFANLDQFNLSKIGILHKVLENVKAKLADYLEIKFIENVVEETIRYTKTFKTEAVDKNIYLIDGIKDEDSSERINELKSEIAAMLPLSKVKNVKKPNTNGLNLILIHNKGFYEKYNLEDPYKLSFDVQHITTEDFKIDSKASIKAVIKESIIKKDIKNQKISIVDWSNYDFKSDWIFGYRQNEEFFYLTIHPDGTLSFENFEPNLFNQTEYDDLCNIFDQDVNIEFLVKDNDGNINSIKRTGGFTIPEFEIIQKDLKNEAQEIKLSRQEAIKIVKNNSTNWKNSTKILEGIESLLEWNKVSLLSCFDNRNEKKTFVELVRGEKGEILKSYLRDMTRYQVLDSQLDIHSFIDQERYFYFVGLKGTGIQQLISRASIIREIKPYKDSKLIFNELLPLMNVDFVKNGDLTVLPFPIKYLREWVNVIDK